MYKPARRNEHVPVNLGLIEIETVFLATVVNKHTPSLFQLLQSVNLRGIKNMFRLIQGLIIID